MDGASDRALVLRVRSGDDDAFADLVRRHQLGVFNVCLRMLGNRNEAEDLTQEAFLRAYRKLDQFDDERPFGPWMRRLTTNLCLNHLARRRPEQVAHDDRVLTSEATAHGHPERASLQKDRERLVRQAVVNLPPHYRAVIELRHFQDLRYQEIADALDLPLSDVKSHLYRARKALALALEGEVHDA